VTDPSRRLVLGQLAAGLGGAWLAAPIAELLAAHDHARHAAAVAPRAFKIFTAVEAADVEAMAAEIIPSDGSPGAVEAHVVHFIDYTLSTIGKDDDRPVYVAGLAMLQEKTRAMFPEAGRFASLSGDQRRQLLTAIEKSGFFQLVRAHTIAGFLGDPKYHGNAGEVGWKHIGFTPAFAYQPPFGDYDAEAAAGSPRQGPK
jgi:gluconate 2-dehydrogenase gamma chain